MFTKNNTMNEILNTEPGLLYDNEVVFKEQK